MTATIESVAQRVLVDLPYEFQRAVTDRLVGRSCASANSTEGLAVESAVSLVLEAHAAGSDWHVHRGVEASLHTYRLWRLGRRMAEGPESS